MSADSLVDQVGGPAKIDSPNATEDVPANAAKSGLSVEGQDTDRKAKEGAAVAAPTADAPAPSTTAPAVPSAPAASSPAASEKEQLVPVRVPIASPSARPQSSLLALDSQPPSSSPSPAPSPAFEGRHPASSGPAAKIDLGLRITTGAGDSSGVLKPAEVPIATEQQQLDRNQSTSPYGQVDSSAGGIGAFDFTRFNPATQLGGHGFGGSSSMQLLHAAYMGNTDQVSSRWVLG